MIAYQPDPGNLCYVSAAKGYRPGGINGPLSSICGSNLASIGLTAGPEIYAADSLWSYELGAKNSLLGGRMQINASAFVIDWNNIQQAVYLPACGQNFVENLGKVRSVGGELEVQARPVEALLLDVSVAHVDAKYTHTVCAGPSSCTGVDPPSQPVVTEGDRLPGAPWTFLTSAEYAFPAVAIESRTCGSIFNTRPPRRRCSRSRIPITESRIPPIRDFRRPRIYRSVRVYASVESICRFSHKT